MYTVVRSNGGEPVVDEAVSMCVLDIEVCCVGRGRFEAFNCCRTFAVICEVSWCKNSGGSEAVEKASVLLKADVTASFIGWRACWYRDESRL